MGLGDGKSAGMKECEEIQRADSAKTIRELTAALDFTKGDHIRLANHCKRLKVAMAFGGPEHQVLLEIAEKLRIAAETFSAFRTGKKLERETRALRDQTLVMVEQLAPFVERDAA